MTLHPWPLNDHGALHPTQQVLWAGRSTNDSQRGLLIDSLAIPLRFASELLTTAPIAAVAKPHEPARESAPAATAEPRHDSTGLLRVRHIEVRFGSGC